MNKWLKKILIACVSVVFFVDNSYSQEIWEDVTEQLLINDDENSGQLENMLEDLTDLKEHPININTATKEQLEIFPFLTDRMIENILYYVYKYGPVLTEKELLMVQDMDTHIVRLLKPFITFEKTDNEQRKLSFKDILKYGKQEFSTRLDIPLYTRKGYQPIPAKEIVENPNKRYLGYAFYHNFRYSFRYNDKVYVGLTAEKDAGEPFFAGKNKKGYDHYSPYVLIKNVGRINALALGNYRLSYGYGLVMNTDFNMGKTTSLSTLGNRSSGIKKHSSTDEYNYFQGVAASFRFFRQWTMDAFYSYRKLDGIVDNQFITSVKEDGYHRIPRDFEKKHSFDNQLIGTNIQYKGKSLKTELTAVYNVFNKVLNPTYRPYNKYYPRGRDFLNVGVNYRYFWKQFTLSGETAIDKKGKIATINLIRYSPKSSFQLWVMNRFYDVAYQSVYGGSIGEGSMVQNESGFYIGLETNVLRYLKLTTYGDFFYFPWKKYQLSKNGTSGFDGVVQISYSPSYELDMFIRYRYKNKYKDFVPDDGEKTTVPYIQQKWKYSLNYNPVDEWVLKTSLDMVHNAYSKQKPSLGFLVSQSIGYKHRKFPLQLNLNAAWFHTDDYASRISIYEKGLLYSFSFPSFYGSGIHLGMNVRYELNEHFIFQFKYAMTCYKNRQVIGTGLEQIDGNQKNDLYFQLRIKF